MNLTSHVNGDNGGDEWSLSSWMYQTKDEKEKKVIYLISF